MIEVMDQFEQFQHIDIYIPNEPDPVRLAEVKAEMVELGRPIITVVPHDDDGYFGSYIALEGSHRTTAAKELGILPILHIVRDAADDDLLSDYIELDEGTESDLTVGDYSSVHWKPNVRFETGPVDD